MEGPEGLQPLHQRVAGIDVHRMMHAVTVLVEQADGSIERETRQFGGFRRNCRVMAVKLAAPSSDRGPAAQGRGRKRPVARLVSAPVPVSLPPAPCAPALR